MFATILTWIGAVAGIAVLIAMAFGAFALDMADARGRKGSKRESSARPAEPTVR